jgi:hypothetical protein
MKSRVLYLTLAIGGLAVALGVGGYWLPRPTNADASANGGDAFAAALAYADNGASGQRRLPDSSTRVSINASFANPVANDGSRELRVTLQIDHGWHVNAHPASLGFLIPTTIAARANGQPLPLKVSYPSGRDSGIRLGDTSIEVYDDDTTISAALTPAALKAAQAAGGLDILVRAQSCSDKGVCLPPARLTVRLPWS